ncbi:hypothetical protein MtrunA17_Chr2g0304911 [Medicago truncatula]|uniref:RRM domain-containing protein n=1 Tax=Medicago truncatula TaxID=3880 RepID=A0A396JFW8_MEDTR|nr:hypothetical protein MtrunA17_Chr2g0304911 [Medicago truncatula]
MNSERAFVQFSKREEAEAALRTPDSVMGNRFINLGGLIVIVSLVKILLLVGEWYNCNSPRATTHFRSISSNWH